MKSTILVLGKDLGMDFGRRNLRRVVRYYDKTHKGEYGEADVLGHLCLVFRKLGGRTWHVIDYEGSGKECPVHIVVNGWCLWCEKRIGN